MITRRGNSNRSWIDRSNMLFGALLVLAIGTPRESSGQVLDDTWTVTVAGQAVQVDRGGGFFISNIAAADVFGPSIPGPPDFLSDSYFRVRGVSMDGALTRYLYSDCFRIRQGQVFEVGALHFSEGPFPDVESIRVSVDHPVLTIHQRTTRVRVTARMSDGSERDVTGPTNCTSLLISNPDIARIDSSGEITGLLEGMLVVTANTEGATAVTNVSIEPDIERFDIQIGDHVSNGVPDAGAGNLGSALNKDIYVFDGSAGQEVYFDAQGTTSAQALWGCTDPIGNPVFSRSHPLTGPDPGTLTLPLTGAYQVTVRPWLGGTAHYQFRLVDVAGATQAFDISLGDTVQNGSPSAGAGQIELPGGVDIFRLTGRAGQRVYFDAQNSLTPNFRWSCSDEQGLSLFRNYSLSGTDAGSHVLSKTGAHTIRVFTSDGSTGTYRFRVLDADLLTDVFAVAIGDTVSDGVPGEGAGRLEGVGSRDEYSFKAAPTTSVYFDTLSASNPSILWSVLGEDGVPAFIARAMNGGDAGTYLLARGGSYRIQVDTGLTGATGTYSFRTLLVPPPEAFAIELGDAVSNGVPGPGAGSIETLGASDDYTLPAEAGQVLYLDAGASDSNGLTWSMTAPNGLPLFHPTVFEIGDVGPLTAPQTGIYMLSISGGASGAIGRYAFRIFDVATVTQAFAVALGASVLPGVPAAGAGVLESVGSRDVYNFNAPAGSGVFFQGDPTAASEIRWRCRDRDGLNIFGPLPLAFGNPAAHTLTRGGAYSIVVESGESGRTGSYRFSLLSIPPPDMFSLAVPGSVGLGNPGPGAGRLEAASSTDIYTFVAKPGLVVYFDALATTNSNLAWECRDAIGFQVFSQRSLGAADPGVLALARGGTYTIRVSSGTSGITGTYSFRLVLPPPAEEFSMEIGDSASNGVPALGAGNLEVAGAVDRYTFHGDVGEGVFFARESATNGRIAWSCVDRLGQTLFQNVPLSAASPGPRRLEAAGAYTITVSTGTSPETGTYSFRLLSIPPPGLFSIEIGDAVSDGVPAEGAGRIETAGSSDVYTFSAPAGKRVYFDSQFGAGFSSVWSCVDGAGTTVFSNTSLDDFSDPGEFALAGGLYTITVSAGQTSVTGTYGFRLLDSDAGRDKFAIAVGDRVNDGDPGPGAGNIELPGSTDVYTFIASADQAVYFDAVSGSNFRFLWSCADPLGDALFVDRELSGIDPGPYELAESGVYTITVRSLFGVTGSYEFQIVPIPPPDEYRISLGTIVSDGVPEPGAGHLESAGEVDRYLFEGEVGQSVFFAALTTDDEDIVWSCESPTGQLLFSGYSLNFGGPGPIELPEGGTYTIDVTSGVGTYSFALTDIAASTDEFEIAIGTTISDGIPGPGAGNLEVPGASDIYAFQAAAGTEVYFDAVNVSVNAITWRCFDEDGLTLFHNSMNPDFEPGRLTLERGGEYTIEVSGGFSVLTGTYSFRVLPAPAEQEFLISPGDTVVPGVPAVGAGFLETKGAIDAYSFNAAAGVEVAFDPFEVGDLGMTATLTDPNGDLVGYFSLGFGPSGPIRLSTAGTYTLRVLDGLGPYSFRLIDYAAGLEAFEIDIGDSVSDGVPAHGAGNLEVRGARDVYTFVAAIGQLVYFDAQGADDEQIYWRCEFGKGDLLFYDQSLEGSFDPGPLEILQTGVHRIIVSSDYPLAVGAYAFQTLLVPPAQEFELLLGDRVSDGVPEIGAGNLENAASMDIYHFDAAVGQTVIFRTLATEDADVRWTCQAPDGAYLFFGFTMADYAAITRALTATGEYTITVSGDPGRYSFEIIDQALITDTFVINIGDTVSNGVPGSGAGNLEVAGAVDRYTFTATPGQTVYFDALGSSGQYILWALRDRSGAALFDSQFLFFPTFDPGARTLMLGGEYTITVFQFSGVVTPGTYSFRIYDVP